MRVTIKLQSIPLFFAIAAAVAAGPAIAQTSTQAVANTRPEIAVEYNFARSNAPAGDCGCFNLNGGSASFAWPLGAGHFSLVGDYSLTHANTISSHDYSLTLNTITGGIRYTPRFRNSHLRPFAQVLAGVAHSSGTLVDGPDSAVSNSGAAFAGLAGGGLDLRASRHFAIRLVEADYLVTTFDNLGNDHQNILRIGAGLIYRF
jgi:outer membrane immunogenic protein